MGDTPLRRLSRGASTAVEGRLRRLDRRLHIDHRGRSEWVWAGPGLTFAGTLALFLVLGVRSGLAALYVVPMGLVLAVVMAGMSVAYMTPEADEGGDDRPPPGHDGSPRPPVAPDVPPRAAWWTSEQSTEEPTPSPTHRRRPTAARR